MRINSLNILSFKGYDAAPLKNVYMLNNVDESQIDILNELSEIGKHEGFGCFIEHDGKIYSPNQTCPQANSKYRWAQDRKIILNKSKGKQLLTSARTISSHAKFAKNIGANWKIANSIFEGGNVFIGKKPDGENFLIIGQDVINDTMSLKKSLTHLHPKEPEINPDLIKALSQAMGKDFENMVFTIEKDGIETKIKLNDNDKEKEEALDALCNDFNVKKENICILPQMEFHLDMFIRPIGYPYVLVNDEQIAKEISDRILGENQTHEESYIDKFYKKDAALDKTIKKLEEKGFIPITVGGVFGKDNQVNFLNALVNKHQDGTITYITGSSKCADENFGKLEDEFTKQLQEKVPNLKEIKYIGSKQSTRNPQNNQMMDNLGRLHGGVHCLVCEEPDFDKWA